MQYGELVAHFGSPIQAARALDVDRRLVDGWKKRRIPTRHQLKAERISDGKLKCDEQAKREAKEYALYLPSSGRARRAAA